MKYTLILFICIFNCPAVELHDGILKNIVKNQEEEFGYYQMFRRTDGIKVGDKFDKIKIPASMIQDNKDEVVIFGHTIYVTVNNRYSYEISIPHKKLHVVENIFIETDPCVVISVSEKQETKIIVLK